MFFCSQEYKEKKSRFILQIYSYLFIRSPRSYSDECSYLLLFFLPFAPNLLVDKGIFILVCDKTYR